MASQHPIQKVTPLFHTEIT